MPQYPPIPLNAATLALVKKTLGVSSEEACQHETMRRFIRQITAPKEVDNVKKEDKGIEFNNIKVDISIIRPKGHEDKVLPVILYLHGGGWAFGEYDQFAVFIDELVNLAQACLVFVHFSSSPEVKYPVALEECYASLCWIQQNACTLNIDLSCLAVAGDSAGGNLSAALTILAKQRGNTGISNQVLFYPVTDANFETDSYIQYQNDALLPRESMQHVWEIYVRSQDDYQLPLVAPLRATLEELKGLPPALVIHAQQDVLRDEGEAYAKKLQEAGVPTLSMRYNNAKHGFVTSAMGEISPEGLAAIQQAASWLRKGWKIASKL